MRRLFARVPVGIPNDRIRTESAFGFRYAIALHRTNSETERSHVQQVGGREFCLRVVRRGLDGFDCVYAFSSDAVEILEEARRRGIAGIVEQTIAPYEIVVDMFRSERGRYPELVGDHCIDVNWQGFADREKREWELADMILCGSQFVVDGIRAVGGPAHKAVVVPYGVAGFTGHTQRPAKPPGAPTNVLFVGEVGFRKGSHYLLKAARKIPGNFRFRFCGNVTLPQGFLAGLPADVELMGIVPRSEMQDHYQWADVFCLPSLVEGSATVTYEAMAMGLPIVTTPNSGSIVRDGIDGYVVAPRDADAIVEALLRFQRNELPSSPPPPTDRPGGPASFTIEAYRERLLQVVDGVNGIRRKFAE